jgi:hypothetical protein
VNPAGGQEFDVAGLAWFSDDVILAVTRHRSLFCIEALSRQPMQTYPASELEHVHEHTLVPLLPGFTPISFEKTCGAISIDKDPRQEYCLLTVSDGAHFIVYRFQVLSEIERARTPQSLGRNRDSFAFSKVFEMDVKDIPLGKRSPWRCTYFTQRTDHSVHTLHTPVRNAFALQSEEPLELGLVDQEGKYQMSAMLPLMRTCQRRITFLCSNRDTASAACDGRGL